ncbi:MAG: hypothetical protein ACYDAS_01340 [Patescibacteria group bacterium]
MKPEELRRLSDIPIYSSPYEIKDGDPHLELLPGGFSGRVRVLRGGILDISSYNYFQEGRADQYAYDQKGRVETSISQNAFGDRTYSWFLYNYNDDLSLFSVQKRSVTVDEYGELLDINVSEDRYDPNTQVLTRKGVDNDGRISLEEHQYEDSLLKSKVVFKDHDVGTIEEYEYVYDEKGVIVKRFVKDQDGNVIATDFYEYNGNLPIKRGSSVLDGISIYKSHAILKRLKKDNTRKKDRRFVIYENRASDLSAILEGTR